MSTIAAVRRLRILHAIHIAVGLMAALAASSAFCQRAPDAEDTLPYRLDLELGAEYSDNRARTDPAGPDDIALIPRLVLDIGRSSPNWQARGAGYIEYRDSMSGDYEDELRANLATAIDWYLVPDSVTWTLQDVASVEPINLFAADSPGNLQQTNVLITGPTWRLRPGRAWETLLDARAINSYAEEVDAFNSNRFSASARLLRRLAPNRNGTMGVEYTNVAYRDEPNDLNDYERLDAVARLHSVQARTEIDMAAGYTWIEPDVLKSTSSPLLRFMLVWQVRDRTNLRLAARHELSDSVRQLTTTIDAIDLPMHTAFRLPVGADLFELSEVELGWQQATQRGQWALVPFWRDYDFEFDPELSFREFGATLAGNWQLTPLLFLQAAFEFERRRFDLDRRRDTDYSAAVYIGRQFSPRWSARAGISREQRESSAAGGDSRENIFAVFLTFHAGG